MSFVFLTLYEETVAIVTQSSIRYMCKSKHLCGLTSNHMLAFHLFRQHHVAIHMLLIHTASIEDPLYFQYLRLTSLKKKSIKGGIHFSPSVWSPAQGQVIYVTVCAMATCFILVKEAQCTNPPFHQFVNVDIHLKQWLLGYLRCQIHLKQTKRAHF